jgi:hypothetical protein
MKTQRLWREKEMRNDKLLRSLEKTERRQIFPNRFPLVHKSNRAVCKFRLNFKTSGVIRKFNFDFQTRCITASNKINIIPVPPRRPYAGIQKTNRLSKELKIKYLSENVQNKPALP